MSGDIIRVFPHRTSWIPTDDHAFVGNPPLWRPSAKEVHVSVTFTWDASEGKRLAAAWGQYYPVVRLGGPAFDDCGGDFTPGLYVKEGITFTSRGCNRNCPWCFVPKREGRIRLLDIKPGHIVDDNNLLQTGHDHILKVFAMLKHQRKGAVFSGGLDTRLIDQWVADQLSDLHISQIFLAADTNGSLHALERAVELLAFLPRDKLRCYVLIGFANETIGGATKRLERVWDIGCLPFAQLYQSGGTKRNQYDPEWRYLARMWSRPAATKAIHKAPRS